MASANPSLSAADRKVPEGYNGEAWKRFVRVTNFLYLMDPVRGEATEHSLDRHPHGTTKQKDSDRKKFLDAFAVIASGDAEGEKGASAVCMEYAPNRPGTTLRLARNSGFNQERLVQLNDLLDELCLIASEDSVHGSQRNDISHRVMALCDYKIRTLLKKIKLSSAKEDIEKALAHLTTSCEADDKEVAETRSHAVNLKSLARLSAKASEKELLSYIEFASRARWRYHEQIERLFNADKKGSVPHWLSLVHKLGRYYTAVKALIRSANKEPNIFLPSITIEPVPAPKIEKLAPILDQNSLLKLILQLTGENSTQKPNAPTETEKTKDIQNHLRKFWRQQEPSSFFRKSCNGKAFTVHAEIQLLAYYDQNELDMPNLNFMGISKKTCYLCDKLLEGRMTTYATHQKIYPSWMPPPSPGKAGAKYRKLLWDLISTLEEEAKMELETRLKFPGKKSREKAEDSSAGISLPTTSSVVSKMASMSVAGGH